MREDVFARRVRPFTERGLLPQLPTRWQRIQGVLEMAPYVVAPDAGDAARYAGAPLGNPVLRQPLTLWHVGPSHFRVGHGLGAPARSLFRHLSFVFHEGMPAYDLQLIQTHPDGLDRFRRYLQEVDAGATAAAARLRRHMALVIPEPEAYRARFLAPGGWIDRAAAFDYELGSPPDDPSYRGEFMTLVHFFDHCARRYPAERCETAWWRLPGHAASLLAARARLAAERSGATS